VRKVYVRDCNVEHSLRRSYKSKVVTLLIHASPSLTDIYSIQAFIFNVIWSLPTPSSHLQLWHARNLLPGTFQPKFAHSHHILTLSEDQKERAVIDHLRLAGIAFAGLLMAGRVHSVGDHGVVEQGSEGGKLVHLVERAVRILIANHRERKLRHAVAVVVRRPVRVFHGGPPRRDDGNWKVVSNAKDSVLRTVRYGRRSERRTVADGVTWDTMRRCGQHCEKGRVRMVEEDAAQDAKASKVILVRIV